MGKNGILFLLVFCMASLTAAPLRIATASRPGKLELLAQEELVNAIAEMTGETPLVIPEKESDGKGVIYLGATAFAAEQGFPQDKLHNEEWVIRQSGENLILTGGRPVGTLYSVYRFLNKLGFYYLAEDAECVPKYSSIPFGGFNERKQPAFNGRLIYDGYAGRNNRGKIDWTPRNRFILRNFGNGQMTPVQKFPYRGGFFNLGGPSPYHSYYHYISPSLFKTHPEYFNMNEQGKRFIKVPQQSQPCLSNPDVRRIMTENLVKYIEKDRAGKEKSQWPRVYDISRMDSTNYICKCPECMRIHKEEGGDCGIEIRCINAIAEAVAEKYPEILIRTFAYASSELPPKLTRPKDNVIVQYCNLYTKTDCYRPLTHAVNRQQLEKLEKWAALNIHLMVWDYWNMGKAAYNTPPRPEVIVDALIGNMKLFHDKGVEALFAEAEKDFATTQPFMDLNYFLGYQLMLDPDQDAEKLIDLYIRNCYGAGAGPVRQYFDLLREGVKNYPKPQRSMQVSPWKHMNPDSYLRMVALLEKAESLAKGDEKAAARIRREMISPLWCALFYWDDCKSRFTEQGWTKQSLVERCRKLAAENLCKDNPANRKQLLADLDKKLEVLSAELSVPPEFRDVPPGEIKVFGYPSGKGHAPGGAAKQKDSESPTGWAVVSAHRDARFHGPEAKVSGNRCLTFALANIGTKEYRITLRELPTDEKFHWYVIPRTRIGGKTTFWGHFWWIQFDLSPAYAAADGQEELNDYDVWFSARFTGPAYVPGSKRENSVSVDRIVLVRSGGHAAEMLRKRNAGKEKK